MNIELHIEELVLHGFAPGARRLIAEAVEDELQRLLAEQGAPNLFNGDAELTKIGAGAFNVKPNAKSDTVGAQVAQAIYEAMNRGVSR